MKSKRGRPRKSTQADINAEYVAHRRAALRPKPDAAAPLGSGGRFAAVEASAKASGARNPGAVAAAIGRKKYGQKKMTAMSVAGRKRAATKRRKSK